MGFMWCKAVAALCCCTERTQLPACPSPASPQTEACCSPDAAPCLAFGPFLLVARLVSLAIRRCSAEELPQHNGTQERIMDYSGGTAPEPMGRGDSAQVSPEAVEAAEAAGTDATTAAVLAQTAGAAATAAAAARAAVAPRGKVRFRDSGTFVRRGLRDFWTNLKRTWLLILAFILYLLAAASALYFFLRSSAQIRSWHQALYRTWISMSSVGELTTRSLRLVLALGILNLFVGLLFFGFIVWLVTTSLYQRPDS